jgi:hypothetical protein
LKRSTFLFLSASRSDEALDRKMAIKEGSAIYRPYFADDLQPNAWSDEISLKRTLIEQGKSYRLVCSLIEFIKKMIELCRVELKEFVSAQRANGFDKRRDT